ncbi:uncharacterized protein EURHEDRAFT_31810 [Aspergillus ruber CBS 135680]|uniref:Uncharacterized protein n=1 Tax=Aspergillus ruber (strain CBS 135680) TaxID=1388766 RepID=A0A017SU63_ASPRC|nr:uncharacterized protein EURHEDRAFT_31810 [Aspergillus ruber CBS 135680]EYE99845.1 hypothetical protein EURHEDRAFT_31810 [Aspergillus ruber CBS 135680]
MGSALHISCCHAIPLLKCTAYSSGFVLNILLYIYDHLRALHFLFSLFTAPISASFSTHAISWIRRQPANGLAIVFLRSILQLSGLSYFPFLACGYLIQKTGRIM